MEEKFFLGNPIKTYTLTERMVIQQRIFHYRILLDASLVEKKKVEGGTVAERSIRRVLAEFRKFSLDGRVYWQKH